MDSYPSRQRDNLSLPFTPDRRAVGGPLRPRIASLSATDSPSPLLYDAAAMATTRHAVTNLGAAASQLLQAGALNPEGRLDLASRPSSAQGDASDAQAAVDELTQAGLLQADGQHLTSLARTATRHLAAPDILLDKVNERLQLLALPPRPELLRSRTSSMSSHRSSDHSEIPARLTLAPWLRTRPMLDLGMRRLEAKGWRFEHGDWDEPDVERKTFTVDVRQLHKSVKALASLLNEPSPFPGDFQVHSSVEEQREWLVREAEATRSSLAEAPLVREQINKVATRFVAGSTAPLRLGPSLRHDNAGLYQGKNGLQEDSFLIISRAPDGSVENVDLPTAFEEQADIEERIYHLLEIGKATINDKGLNRFENGRLEFDPNSGNLQAVMDVLVRASMEADPHFDFTPDQFAKQPSGAGTEKQMFRLNDCDDRVLMVFNETNTETGGRLSRRDAELELISLRRLAALGYPVPATDRVVRVDPQPNKGDEGRARWGFVLPYYPNTFNTKRGSGNPNLNLRTLQEAQALKEKLKADDIEIFDLQCLVKEDGGLVIIDPKGFKKGASAANAAMLDELIQAAQANINADLRSPRRTPSPLAGVSAGQGSPAEI